MDLSRQILKDFADVTRGVESDKTQYLRGTIKSSGETKYVRIDGSESLTPISEIVDVKEGDRVLVTIENHEATILGNLTKPPSSYKEDEAIDKAEGAQDTADDAKNLAQTAGEKADAALEDAKNASTSANEAKENAQEAIESANVASEKAEEAKDLATSAGQNAQTAVEEAASAQNAASAAQGEVTRIEGVVTEVKGDINTALEEVADQAADLQATKETMELNYAKKTEVSDIEASLTTEISKKVGELQTTVSQTYAAKNDVVDLEGRLQSQITQTAEGVTSVVGKVEKLESDTTEAQQKVDEALEKSAAANAAAEQAQADATAAQTAADVAKENAHNATIKANEAVQNAATAAATAAEADKKVSAAKTDLAEAKENLANTINRVGATEQEIAAAQQKVDAAQAAVTQAQKDAAEATAAANNAQDAANKAQTDATEAQSAATNAQKKADTAVIAASNAQAAANKAQQDVAALTKRVTNAETAITQNAEQIRLSATKTEEIGNRLDSDTNGINLFSIANSIKGYRIVDGSTVGKYPCYSDSSHTISELVPCSPGDVFTVSTTQATNDDKYITIGFFDETKVCFNRPNGYVSGVSAGKPIAFTAPKGSGYVAVSCENSLLGKVKLERGKTATPFTKAIADQQTDIDSTNSNLRNNYYSKTQTDAAINVASDSITTAVRKEVTTEITNVNNKVDNLKLVGENLILNGYGEFCDNKNFTNYTFDGANSYNNRPSFKTNLKTTLSIGNNRIPIDIGKAYQFSMNIKSDKGGTIYLGWTEYDIDGNRIGPSNVFTTSRNTITNLSKDLNDGDTVIHLDSTAGWVASDRSYHNGLIFWNYRDSTGHLYPEGVYSRNVWFDLYTKENVNKTNNTITLKSPWNHGTIPAGTRVSQSNDGGTYKYRNFIASSAPTSWTNTSFRIGEDYQLQAPYSYDLERFSPAAKSIAFMAMWSYGTSVVDTYYINSIELKSIDDKLLIDGINNNLQNNYYSKTQTDAAIKVASDNVTTTVRKEVTTVNNKVDNLQVGGRNLLKDTANFGNNGRPSGSKDGWLDSYDSTIESEKYNGLTVRSLKNVSSTKTMCNYYFTGFNLGDTYTLSFWAKGTIDRFRCYFYGDSGYVKARAINASIPYYNNSVYGDGYCAFVNPKITNWTRISVTWKLDSVGNINIAKKVLIRTDEATRGDLYVCGVKLEKGNKATDWTPAPEDQQTQIDGINNNLSNNYYAKTTVDSKISTATSGITAQYTQDITNRLGNYYDKTTIDSKLTIDGTGISTYVKNTQSKLDNLQVGGRNLLLQTGFFTGGKLSGVVGDSNKVNLSKTIITDANSPSGKAYRINKYKKGTENINGGCYWVMQKQLTPGKKYTWSAYVRGVGTVNTFGPEQGGAKAVALTSTWTKVSHTFTANSNKYYQFTFYSTSEFDLYLTDLMLEEGTTPSPWSPAPEDFPTITQYTEVKQLADRISSTVYDSASGLVTKTTQLAGKYAIQNLNSYGDVLSSLNMNGGNVRIKGSLIELDGNVRMQNAFISNLKSNTILVNEIKAQATTIVNAKITNLDASYIKSGYISTDRLKVNDLSTLSANLGRITSGYIGNSNSYWDLSTGNFFNSNGTNASISIGKGRILVSNKNSFDSSSVSGTSYDSLELGTNCITLGNSSGVLELRPKTIGIGGSSGSATILSTGGLRFGYDFNATVSWFNNVDRFNSWYDRSGYRYQNGRFDLINGSFDTTGGAVQITANSGPVNLQGASANMRNKSNTAYVDCYAQRFSSQSAHSIKTDFEDISMDRLLEAVVKTDIVTFRFKNDTQRNVGFVINDDGKSPYKIDNIIVDDNGKSFNSTTTIGILFGAVKALNRRIEILQGENQLLKARVEEYRENNT